MRRRRTKPPHLPPARGEDSDPGRRRFLRAVSRTLGLAAAAPLLGIVGCESGKGDGKIPDGGRPPAPDGGSAAGADATSRVDHGVAGPGARRRAAAERHPGVLLIVIEATPAALLRTARNGVPITPALHRLAAESAVFDRFYAASPWTLPSLGTILTGVSPSVHLAGQRWEERTAKRENRPNSAEPGFHEGVSRMDKDAVGLPRLLEGVKTGAIMNNVFLAREFGLSAGFADYDCQCAGFGEYRDAAGTTDAAVAWLRANRGESFFLLVHYFDPHVPYRPPHRHRRRFCRGEAGRIDALSFEQLILLQSAKLRPRPAEIEHLSGLHDGEVAFADEQIGRLLAVLESDGILDGTWVIVTADHGEELYEHGSFEHGHRFEDEVTRVPCLVRPPAGAGETGIRIPGVASHVDLAPTVLDILGRGGQADLEGRSLLPAIRGERMSRGLAFIEFNLRGDSRWGAVDDRYKLIENRHRPGGLLYDHASDRDERRPVKSTRHPAYREMHQKLHAYLHARIRRWAPRKNGEIPGLGEDQRETLHRLGYLE